VRRNRTGITSGNRSGESTITEPKRVVERRMQQGRNEPLRVLHPGRAHDLFGLRHEGHQVVGAVRKPRVVHRPVLLLDPHRLGTHLQHERFSDGPQRPGCGDPEAAVGQPKQVRGGAREGHHRMQGQPEYVMTGRGLEDRRAVATRGVHHELSSLPRARGAQPVDQRRQGIVRDREQDQLGPRDDLLHGRDRYAGQQRRGPRARLLAHSRHGHQAMAGLVEGGTEDGTYSAGPDDADVESGGSPRRRSQVTHSGNGSASPGHVAFGPMTWTPWKQAWDRALYGEDGFYRQVAGPAGHFSTASEGMPQIGELLARALVKLMDQKGLDTLVDIGCGRGELLEQVHRLRPQARCIGVDIVARPQLSTPIGWLRSPGGELLPDELDGLSQTLVFANEWLDVVPCPIAELDQDGELCEVLVNASTGDERLADPVSGADRRWCQLFWPVDHLEPGDRVEIGAPRDRAWDNLVSRVGSGLAVAVDYGHTIDSRPAPGTLTGFRQGRQVLPVPDGSCDLTAHVCMDSLTHDELIDQRTALRQLGVNGRTPPHDLARSHPAAYLRGLSTASAATALTARGGLGDFLWAFAKAR
jgi:SAM-dependent MidA family methyltransferase